MPLVGWGAGPKIENNVVYCSARAAYKLVFLVRWHLKVKTTQRMFPAIVRDIKLRQLPRQAARLEFATAPAARKKAPLIFVYLDPYDIDARDCQCLENHVA